MKPCNKTRTRLLFSYIKWFILLLFIISFVGLSLSCKGDEQASTSPTPSESASTTPQGDNMTTMDPSSALKEIEANFSTAREKARAWQANALYYSASSKIPQTLDFKDVIEVYTFGSSNVPLDWWTISISVRSKNYIRAIIPKEDYLGAGLRPIDTKYWKINYVEAFQVAEKNGGAEWRSKNTQPFQVTCVLAHGDPNGYLYWTVEYSTLSNSDKKSIQINANNGDVVGETSPSPSASAV